MAKKKKKEDLFEESPAVEDSITIEQVKQFIADVQRKRESWLLAADRSWLEAEKRNAKGRLYGGQDLDRRPQWIKFPLWWTCWQIRRPLTLARLSVPVIKDTQGDDPIGRTACVIGERFVKSILKTFDAFPEFEAANDDFLLTDFGWGRWFYRNNECVEEEKLRLQLMEQPPQVGPDGQPLPPGPPIPVMPDGTPAQGEILEDEKGPYLLTGQEVLVDNEEVYFEAGLYSNLYVDPDARRWNQVTRLAFEYEASYREFIKKFGKEALTKLQVGDIEKHKSGTPIRYFEYQDLLLKEVRWFAENSTGFIQPVGMVDASALKEVTPEEYDNSDIYGLSKFFPCTKPLIINNSTRDFWPTPEYFQVRDMLDDINQIVSRMFLLTKAIRARFLFDSSIRELKQLIGETGEGGGLGIPNLQQSLIAGKGTLATLVQYFPVGEMIEALSNMYTAFDQRLNMFYQATGLNELMRGQTSDVEKTFGERQLEGKFAMNRAEPRQRKVQEWLKDNYQLGMELGLKTFSDATIDDYITPQTLDPEDKERYVPGLALLKDNKKSRFRVDFETDSTIAINEQWRRAQAIEMANVITKMLESVAKTAQDMPEIAPAELKIMQHVVGELTDGKQFKDEIQDAIEDVIEKAKQPKPQEPNVDLEKLKLEGQKVGADMQFKQIQLSMQTQLKYSELAQQAQQDSIKNQLEQLKIMMQNGAAEADMQLAVTKLQAEIAQGWETLALKKEDLLSKIQSEFGKKEMETMRIVLDARVKSQEMTLAEADQALKAYEVQLMSRDSHASLMERIATEQRLQDEHKTDLDLKHVEAAAMIIEAQKEEPAKGAPISIDLSKTLQIKEGNKTEPKKKSKKKV